GGTAEGQKLRELLLSGEGLYWDRIAELLLINAARAQHVEKVIAPALAAGKWVLCDRFVGSTLAYQGAGHGIASDVIRELHRLAARDLWPDLTLVLDLDPEAGLRRSRQRLAAQRLDEGRFEALDLAFHRRVRQSFLDQAAQLPHHYAVINADRAPSLVAEDLLRHLLAALA
ncbi:MAG TPA: dTMP kinase, partial [Stellaceae bacterium]|nr:dTMP kinase [Stellaceae bacterium]